MNVEVTTGTGPGLNVAVLSGEESSDERQAHAPVQAAARGLGGVSVGEDVLDRVGRHPGAGVIHLDPQLAGQLGQLHGHLARNQTRSVSMRTPQSVPHHEGRQRSREPTRTPGRAPTPSKAASTAWLGSGPWNRGPVIPRPV